ncbi:cell division protein FtsZ [Meinhardsimonia xiamenensis]|jgi:cell division protein FtsZ|uniref:Cell division protein FtsZ n=1 Tax=Meinhardsimonia xiamenensis TaxID=990712 RepID=A0A1G9CKR5_9RHOB|nr:cell division protein FtsZ [Meinhardsimonia xiamenensis]PRX38325.1 cell division protein FtsZ [Meinhardsimonia xiamenensis]SDK52281.1 cell division protein FtsZ [Meinhardsimonia xiamenensis]
MTLNLKMPEEHELKPRITVFGVGGAGCNAVNNMIAKQLEGVEFVVANTDAQSLAQSKAPNRIQIGVKVTEGLGAGARPSVGAAAAEESIEQIVDHLAGTHMCFITAGMGGGTGTGAAPIIAQAARELGVLTVGVVTKPFQFEGAKRMRQAEQGVEMLQRVVDTLIIIPNQNLFRLANEKTTFTEAFAMADDVLYQGVKGVTDLMVRPGLINLDFADVRAVMDEMGKAMMGTGEASGEDRARQAAEKAIANPLLDEISLKGAKGVLINITGGYDLTLFELDEAANRIREEVDPDANIIVGSTLDESMEGMMRVSVVATGIDANQEVMETPVPRRRLAEPLHKPSEVEQTVAASHPEAARAAADAVAGHPPQERHQEAAQSAPGLFDALDPVAAAAEEQAEHIFDEPEAAQDDLPPPAYRPGATGSEAPYAAADEETRDYAWQEPRVEPEPEPVEELFVAPKPGAPSPEALARLRAAVQRSPAAGGAARTLRSDERAEPREVEKPRRGGLGSLIGRMTGATGSDPRAQAPARRVAPPPLEDDEALDPEQERIEIPAFLRRQAN